MEKLTITYIGRFTTDREGNPLVSKKTGKPYTSLRIKCNEYGDKYLSGFDGPSTQSWKEGDTVEVEVKPNGEYLNFEVPRQNKNGGMSSEQFEYLARAIKDVTASVHALRKDLVDSGVIKELTSDGKVVAFENGAPNGQGGVYGEDTREAPPITEEELAGVF